MHLRHTLQPLYLIVFIAGILSVGNAASTTIVINEIHYNPDVKTEPAEFIELFNPGTNKVDVGGWSLSSGLDYTIPAGTNMPPGSYLVVAQNPTFLLAKFGAKSIGPYAKSLSKYGDKIVLKNASGDVVDEVNYQLGFPWPTIGDPPGYSIELIHPSLDNDLAGSWRASVVGNPAQQTQVLIPDHATWSYVKGTNEASNPTSAWRQPGFDDSAWSTNVAPFGYGEAFIATAFNDMQNNYSSAFFRKKFVVADVAQITSLILDTQFDDGAKIWINGSNVLNVNIASGEVPFNGFASTTVEATIFLQYILTSPAGYLVAGTNTIAVQAHNVALGSSSDFVMDLKLSARSGPTGNGPTPGRINSVYATNAPPQIRQVAHTPPQPAQGQLVTITAKVTDPDGVASVMLNYQIVEPGNYIELTDPAYTNSWTTVAMNDGGTGGDLVAGDDLFTYQIPASVQLHRRLIRYRITVTDTGNRSVRVPYADDPQPNFAYFVYNGAPAWSGAVQPGAGGTNGVVITVSSNEMNRMATYHLISKSNSVLTATGWNPGAPNNQYTGDNYLWSGAMVYDGIVYDHIGYRMRGGVWRYAMGKNAWKFSFNRGHDLQGRDDWGKKYNAVWRRLSFRPDIQQGDFLHRGEQGMFESVGYKLFRLAGVDAPKTTHVQFRIIDDPQEAPAANQYGGDFYGLYLIVEEQDGRFLEERHLPDGNIYDMESGSGTLNHTGSAGPIDKSDLNTFLNTYTTTTPTDAWWRTNFNLGQYYSYQTIVQGMHQFDIADGKNYFYYLNPVTKLWEVWPWDLDLSWADNMYRAGSAGGDEPFKSRVLNNFASPPTRPQLTIEFKNRVREIRDLLFNTNEAFKVIDEMSALIHGPAGYSIIDADRCQWDYNPIMNNSAIVNLSKAGNYHFYQWQNEPGTSNNFYGASQVMKNYINYRNTNANLGNGVIGLDGLAADSLIPSKPVITFTGPTNFPINRLTFRSSNFNGGNAFAAMKWRVGEITDTNSPSYDPTQPRVYEITAAWESAAINSFVADVTIPSGAVKIGHRYRARVQMLDNTGRSSNWSAPIEFTCGDPQNEADLLNFLRITEVMYNPAPGGFEFIELHNTSPSVALDLNGVKFTQGIDFTFLPGTTLLPGGYLLVIGTTNVAGFRAYYGLDVSVPIVGPYSGSLNNGGEQVVLRTLAGGTDIVAFSYKDGRGWPLTADGAGHSLVLLDAAENAEGAGSGEFGGNWRASGYLKGSPGRADSAPAPTIVLNEIVAHTDFTVEFDSNDWIELYNLTAAPITFGPNWFLSDDPAALLKWAIPSNTVIAAHGWVSFDEVTGFHNPTNTGFGLDKAGEQVFLSYLPGTLEDRVVDSVSFKGQENDWSWGRYPDGGANWYGLTPRTRDTTNAAPPLRVVVNEIMYHPPDIGGTNDNSVDEFIELYNPTLNAISLFNTNGPWRMDGGVSFTFPTNLTLAAGDFLLVVNFDPTNATSLEGFRTVYGITNANLLIVGPYSGKLANSSDRVALEKPQAPDIAGGALSWVIVDEAIYADQPPWPCGSDGTGASLQRQNNLGHGSDPQNWAAASPTAGRANAVLPAGVPTISAQPQSRAAAVGSQVSFSVGLCGNPPFNFQWRFNDHEIAGANGATITLYNVQLTNSGNYSVVISNAAGLTTSDIAVLTVQLPPVISSQPQSLTVVLSNTASFAVTVSGTPPFQYQWRFFGANLPGATNQSLGLTNVQAAQAGDYSVLVSTAAGSVPSSNATLTVLVPVRITTPPQSVATNVGFTVPFSVVAVGSGTLFYQWSFNGTNIANATNASLNLTNVQPPQAGNYVVVITNFFSSVTSSVATLTLYTPPVFTQQPLAQTVASGSSVTFSATLTGTLPINCEWRRASTPLTNFVLSNTNFTSFTLVNVRTTDSGQYKVIASNVAKPTGVPSGIAQLAVLDPIIITAQPTNQIVNAGSNATLRVTVTGSAPIYQWKFFGTNLLNATNNTLALTNVQATNEGGYSVMVTNLVSSVTSQVAVVSLRLAPSISVPPQPQTVVAGSNATFSVTAGGSPPFSYQWRLNGADLSGATNVTLTLTNAQPINEGSYSVVVTNTVGSATSPSALLTVLIRPILSNPMMLPGGGFQMTLSGNTNRTYAVETSTNLYDWAELTTLLYTNGAMIWKDSTATNSGNRIYRLRLAP